MGRRPLLPTDLTRTFEHWAVSQNASGMFSERTSGLNSSQYVRKEDGHL